MAITSRWPAKVVMRLAVGPGWATRRRPWTLRASRRGPPWSGNHNARGRASMPPEPHPEAQHSRRGVRLAAANLQISRAGRRHERSRDPPADTAATSRHSTQPRHRRRDALATGGRAVEQIVPREGPDAGDRRSDHGRREQSSYSRDRPRVAEERRVRGCGRHVVGRVRRREVLPVMLCRPVGPGKEGFRGGAATSHCLRDPFALQWIHQSRGVAGQ